MTAENETFDTLDILSNADVADNSKHNACINRGNDQPNKSMI